MMPFRPSLLLLAALLGGLAPAAPASEASSDPLASSLDATLTTLYRPEDPGAAVIAVRDGRTVLRKAYGMADLELGVPLAPEMVFRIGSMTKQFTAVAVLMLAEEGKLATSDPITKFLPDYPTGGKTITVEHLLTHTSGIKSFTDMPDFRANMRKDYTLAELIDHFKDQPMEFAPGERHRYCNSGYLLLGAIIEQASGVGYEAFLKQRIFDVVGMERTALDSTSRVIRGRARGYAKVGEAWTNADWMSMTQPHAAGALVSTVDDLAKWDAALYTGRLLRAETLQRAFTPHRLTDGRTIHYGYGWQPGTWEGFTILQHGGGINGFVSSGVRVPERRAFVAVLSNRIAAPFPIPIGQRIASYLLDRPWQPTSVTVAPSALAAYAGTYRGEPSEVVTVTVEGGRLYTQGTRGARTEALALSEAEFCYPDSMDRLRFETDSDGRVTALVRLGFGAPPSRLSRAAEASPEPAAAGTKPGR